jgi:hypothetical protein
MEYSMKTNLTVLNNINNRTKKISIIIKPNLKIERKIPNYKIKRIKILNSPINRKMKK